MIPRSIAENITAIHNAKTLLKALTGEDEYFNQLTHKSEKVADESTFLAHSDVHLLDSIIRLLQGETECINSRFHQFNADAPVPVMCWSTLVPRYSQPPLGIEMPLDDSLGRKDFDGAILADKPENAAFREAFINLLELKADKGNLVVAAASTENLGTSHFIQLDYRLTENGKGITIQILDSVSPGIIEGNPDQTAREDAEHSTHMSKVLMQMFRAMLKDKFPGTISVYYRVSKTPQDAANCGIDAVLNEHDLNNTTLEQKKEIRNALQTINDSKEEQTRKIIQPLVKVIHTILVENDKKPSYDSSVIEFIPEDLRKQKLATPKTATPRNPSTTDHETSLDQALFRIVQEESAEAQRLAEERMNSNSKSSSPRPSLTIYTTNLSPNYPFEEESSTSSSVTQSGSIFSPITPELKIDEEKSEKLYQEIKTLSEAYFEELKQKMVDLWTPNLQTKRNKLKIEDARIQAKGKVESYILSAIKDDTSIALQSTHETPLEKSNRRDSQAANISIPNKMFESEHGWDEKAKMTQIGKKLLAMQRLLNKINPKEDPTNPPKSAAQKILDFQAQFAEEDQIISKHRTESWKRYAKNIIAFISLFTGIGTVIVAGVAAYSYSKSGSPWFWKSEGEKLSDKLHNKLDPKPAPKSAMRKSGNNA